MAYQFNPFTGTLDYYLLVPISAPLTPTTLQNNLSVASHSQLIFRQHMILNSYSVVIGTDASLVGV